MLSKCGVGEDSRESLGQQGGQTSQLNKINSEYSLEQLMLKLKFQCLGEEQTHWAKPWCWERLREGGEGSNREWDGWMASPLNEREFELTPGYSEGQGWLETEQQQSLYYCDSNVTMIHY